jgi:outer membrane protein OmpA-like peptidoglycan-associated protein
LSGIVETRRTALGVVMNLGSDAVEFDFDKATLRPENRELLSRIAGVLLTSTGYRVQIHGHTDDIGSSEYNQRLSERRAKAVQDYLVDAGIDPGIVSTKGHGKANPLLPGTTPKARAKNRRVEIGIIDTTINYEQVVADP